MILNQTLNPPEHQNKLLSKSSNFLNSQNYVLGNNERRIVKSCYATTNILKNRLILYCVFSISLMYLLVTNIPEFYFYWIILFLCISFVSFFLLLYLIKNYDIGSFKKYLIFDNLDVSGYFDESDGIITLLFLLAIFFISIFVFPFYTFTFLFVIFWVNIFPKIVSGQKNNFNYIRNFSIKNLLVIIFLLPIVLLFYIFFSFRSLNKYVVMKNTLNDKIYFDFNIDVKSNTNKFGAYIIDKN